MFCAFRSAPASASRAHMSSMLLVAASIRLVEPIAFALSSCVKWVCDIVRSACCRMARATLACLLCVAMSSTFQSVAVRLVISAPASNSTCRMGRWPDLAASSTALYPSLLCKSRSALASTSRRTAGKLSFSTAYISALHWSPLVWLTLTLGSCSRRRSTARHPKWLAKPRAVSPVALVWLTSALALSSRSTAFSLSLETAQISTVKPRLLVWLGSAPACRHSSVTWSWHLLTASSSTELPLALVELTSALLASSTCTVAL
mmetsp:Transcript_35986/g.70732  ORF Transcript_35986/g.70732 Transcript_35986/m.70732 type:complete len:261 (-) Transcript_35986:433-1215(-)